MPCNRNFFVKLPIALCLAGAVVGCGGGDDDGSSDVSIFNVDPASLEVKKGVTDKSYTYSIFGSVKLASESCGPYSSSYSVQETNNSVVYSNGSVAVDDLVSAARYTEASILTLRSIFKLPPTVGINGEKIRVCVGSNFSGGSGGYNTLSVERRSDSRLQGLIFHELIHVYQSSAMRCVNNFLPEEKWFVEGMAEAIASTGRESLSKINSTKAIFTGTTKSPYDEISARVYPNFSKYPAYTSAYDVALGESKKTHLDAYNFLKKHGDEIGCNPTPGVNGWKSRFEAYFGVELRGSGALGSGFWDVLPKYLK